MIILRSMKWSNWYSYGKDNIIYFDRDIVTQVLGVNGSGKSSIPLILEEILYNKNSKGHKKQNIPNRELDDNTLSAELNFDVDNDNYLVKLIRKTSLKLSLFKNSEDISSHTATNTYKKIEQIIGMDFKTFIQLVYQSSKASLQFLTATDSQRKAFLITLFNLDKYLRILEIFKEKYKDVSKKMTRIEGTCDALNKWVEKHKDIQDEKDLLVCIPKLEDEYKELGVQESNLRDISKINKQLTQNNQYIKLLGQIDINVLSNPIKKVNNTFKEGIQKDITVLTTKNDRLMAKLKHLKNLDKSINCPTCDQQINKEKTLKLVTEYKNSLDKNNDSIWILKKELRGIKEQEVQYLAYKRATEEFENLSARIDKTLSMVLLDEQELLYNIAKLKKVINENKIEIDKINKKNIEISGHNSRVKVITSQLEEYDAQLDEETGKLIELEDALASLDILRKTFSTSGLISYKIEYLVKDLQMEINKYLQEFSYGKFQLVFVIQGDKLNININNNNKVVDISSLSSGELAKVNISTLLAIRKLMSNISKTKINILFLDEIMGVLDRHARDKLIEVLLEEKDLNTFLVSHEYTHPLLEKINVIKEKNISRLEYG